MLANVGAGDHRRIILLLFRIYRAFFIGLTIRVVTKVVIGMMCCISQQSTHNGVAAYTSNVV
jgi:hypothetical protein